MIEPLILAADSPAATRRCDREGCAGVKTWEARYCSALCMEIDRRLETTRAFIARKGISPATAALWAAAVSLSDQLSELDRLEKRLGAAEAAAF